jgi:single-strand DNA-binding protein
VAGGSLREKDLMLPRATVECGVVFDPELRFTPSGKAVVKVRVVAKDRVRGSNGEWQDGDPMFFDIVVWEKMGENLVESVRVGDQLVVTGKFRLNEWEKDGVKNTRLEMVVEEAAVSLRWNPAKTPRALDEGGSPVAKAAVTQAVTDPWGQFSTVEAVQSETPPF